MTNESQIEQSFIETLEQLKYTYRPDIRDLESLKRNFRRHFEQLNQVSLSEQEFQRLLDSIITPDVYVASKNLRERNTLERDNGDSLHFTLVNLKDWCKNTYEVVNQLRINTESSHHRYDVILLINGIPTVQVELKTLAISPRRAMQQIVDYKNDPGNGYTRTLMAFVQLFVVSNRSDTWYFANNNPRHFAFNADERFLPLYQFADRGNKKITHLYSFAQQFLAKCTLGETISRYMVLVASEQKLIMMRPYQVYAVQSIVDCIHENRGNGYIWHTTGSGKTLTSFKASTLLKDNPDIEKCIFVVDRKDLDRQTREEFNRFQEGCVEENTNTETLVRRLLSTNYADKVIVTTIQKLGLALTNGTTADSTPRRYATQAAESPAGYCRDGDQKISYKQRLEPLRNKRVVFIFDECHRSQFGENHKAIKEFFPNSQLFGFTGTPIFEQNSNYKHYEGQTASYVTTKDIFQKQLHAYTITHAIEDKNVLQFHVDYYKPEGKNPPKPGEPLAQEAVARAILEKHDAATAHRKFNALFATSSINQAIEYYRLFKKIQGDSGAKGGASPDGPAPAAHAPATTDAPAPAALTAASANATASGPTPTFHRPLTIACVFSPPAEGNKDVQQIQEDLPQEKLDNQEAPEEKKAALKDIIADYNRQFGTNHDLANFDLYYQDIQKRIKDQAYSNTDLPADQKIDLVIVVDMLLTGFDSKYLNTLYVDKNLKYHGLIQAFSRTNRVLNDSKQHGQILDFRSQKQAVDEAIALFSGEDALKAKEIWLVDPAPVVIDRLQEALGRLDDFMHSQGLDCLPHEVRNLHGDEARTQFVHLFKEVQRFKTQLDQYTDLAPEDVQRIDQVLPSDLQMGFKAMYLETARGFKDPPPGGTPNADLTNQLDFEFVLFASAMIDYDYIMGLIANYSQLNPERQKMTRDELIGLIRSDAKFFDESQDIADYIDTLANRPGLTEQAVKAGYLAFKDAKNAQRITHIAHTHGIAAPALQAFVERILQRLIFDGESLGDLLAPLDLGWKARAAKEVALMADLVPLLHSLAQGRDISGLGAYEK
ncbi:MAG: type I restriction endonuclease subunit R [Spirochaetales bacterium]|nr:type I restriction endonuclease subunit R [Spirochaetales bacterium]